MVKDDAVVRALEHAPAILVPEDFAARVMARVPGPPPRRMRLVSVVRMRRSNWGGIVAWTGIALVLAAMLWIASRSNVSVLWLCVQALLFAECSGLLLWFTYRSASR